MDVVDLKTWHWVLIGAIAGGVFAGAHVSGRKGLAADNARTMGQQDFERSLTAKTRGGLPVLSNLTLHPKDSAGFYWITGRLTSNLRIHENPKDSSSPIIKAEMTAPMKYRAADPYRPLGSSVAASKMSIFAYLDAARHRDLGGYRFAWYERPAIECALWFAGLTALIGGVWPPTLRLLVGAGFGPRLQQTFDWSQLMSPAEKATIEANRLARLRIQAILDWIAEYQSRLSPAADSEPTRQERAALGAPIRRLLPVPSDDSGTLEPHDSKEFDGEFYPTETHVKHTGEPDQHDA